MEEYKNNPIFNDQIMKFDGQVPSVSFDYKWDSEIKSWVPNTGNTINLDLDELNLDIDLDLTNEILQGISGSLDQLNIDSHLIETKNFLSGISGVLEEQGETKDEETHRLLSGISGVLEEQGETKDEETHRLLSGISGVLEEQGETKDEETHRILSGISGDSSSFYLSNDTNLKNLKDSIENIEINVDNIIIDDIDFSPILDQDKLHYIESERLLRSIKDSSENLSLSIEELKKNYREITFHVKTFEQYSLKTESNETKNSSEDFMEVLHNCAKDNGLVDSKAQSDTNDCIVMSETAPDTSSRIGSYEENMPHAIRLENYNGSDYGWHNFLPISKNVGKNDRITIFNDDTTPLDITFSGSTSHFPISPGHKMEMSKEEAYQLFVRRQYAISTFQIRYSIERMYTPEQKQQDTLKLPNIAPEQTKSRLGIGDIMIDSQHAYVAHNNEWKRIALSTWTHCSVNKNQVFPIDYFDAYTDNDYLYLCKNNIKRRIAISDWESEGKVPIEASSNLWIDESYIYAKSSGHSNNVGGSSGEYEWIRYAIGEYL